MKIIIKIIFTLIFVHCLLLTANAQWFTQQSGTTDPLYDIEFINKNTGWCCGAGGYIIKTTNGGNNWIRQGSEVAFESLFGIHPVDSNIVYAVGFFRTVVKTTDGGEHWIKVESGMQGDGRYTCLFFINQNTGWIGNFGPGYGVRKTTDGGKTIFSNPFLGYPEDLYFKDSQNGIGVGGSAQIFRTSNGGQNWSIDFLAGSGDFYRVSFINGNTGFTASDRAVYKTTNFGINWDSVGNIPAIVISIGFSTLKTGYAGTAYSILKSIDGGKSWVPQVSTGVIYDLFSENDSIVWGCGNGGRIWHTKNGGISSVNNNSMISNENFNLSQNYPNPFNITTVFKFQIKNNGVYKLEIYNSIGQKLKKIFENNFLRGNYEVLFDATNLSSGVYNYKLTGDNNSQTKKFVLIK